MKEIKAIIQPFVLERVVEALESQGGLPGVTVSEVIGWGKTRGRDTKDSVTAGSYTFARKSKLEIVVPDHLADQVAATILRAAHTGNVGDGKIFVYEVSQVIKIRTGERGDAAI